MMQILHASGNFIAATGGTVTTCGDFKIHTFTGPGTFKCIVHGTSCRIKYSRLFGR